MSFMTAPAVFQKILLIGMLIAAMTSAYDIFLCIRRKGKPYSCMAAEAAAFILSAYALINLTVYVYAEDLSKVPEISRIAAGLPVWIYAVAEAVVIAASVCAYVVGQRGDRRRLSNMSVKESFDNLPGGICFYEESGLPRLINLKINGLSVEITGKALLSGKEFWRALTGGGANAPCESEGTGETPMIRTGSGKVYSFKRIAHEIDGRQIYEIVATDITRRYDLSVDLEKKNRELTAFNKRMREYGEKIQELTAESETLNAKIRIHDELGKLLLTTRRSLSGDMTTEEKAGLLALWKNDLTAFRSAKGNAVSDSYGGLYAAAEAVGVKVEITGAKPKDKKLKKIVLTAAIECITNAVKHAKGDRVYVSLRGEGAFLKIEITNNGEPPKEEIREGGGFSSLRFLVERTGGEMKILSLPEFRLEIKVPSGGEI